MSTNMNGGSVVKQSYTVTYEVITLVEVKIMAEDEDDAYDIARDGREGAIALVSPAGYQAEVIKIVDESDECVYEY